MSTRVARYHLHQLNLIVIRRYFGRFLHDITLISEEDLQRLGPLDLVIA